MIGPIFSPANAAVTDYLAKYGGIPSISIYGQPIDNMKTANSLSFVPGGLFSFAGYMTGKYAAEELGYKTANCINYEDTAGRQLQEGFNHGFEEAGGTILSTQFVPIDAVDFSSYLTSLKDADCTYWWIFGNGAAPFVKQYNDYGLTAPLITAMASNLTEPQLADLGEVGARPHRRRVLFARDRRPAEHAVRRGLQGHVRRRVPDHAELRRLAGGQPVRRGR